MFTEVLFTIEGKGKSSYATLMVQQTAMNVADNTLWQSKSQLQMIFKEIGKCLICDSK